MGTLDKATQDIQDSQGIQDMQDFQDIQDTQDIQDVQDSQDSQRQTRKTKRVDQRSTVALFSPSQEETEQIQRSEEKTATVGGQESSDLGLADDVAELLSLPLEVYLRKIADQTMRMEESRERDKWHSPMFTFARFAKCHPEIADLADYDAMTMVEEAMSTWPGMTDESNPWAYVSQEEDPEIARLDFMNSWAKVRHVPFSTPLENAFRLSIEHPLQLPHQRGPLYEQFVSLAGWLQKLRPGEAIFLPVRDVGKLLSCHPATISTLRGFAMRDGLLTVSKEASFARREATEFRFDLGRVGEGQMDK
jgi:hypothetical protein